LPYLRMASTGTFIANFWGVEAFNPAPTPFLGSRLARSARAFVGTLVILGALCPPIFGQIATPMAPPPAPPVVTGSALAFSAEPDEPSAQYSIGEPTNDEQYYLELVNRARANPTAEGLRLATTTDTQVQSAYASFGVNLVLMQAQFALIPAQPPLSMNAVLSTAARAHSQNMLQNNYQGHSGPDGSLSTRLQSYTSGANGWSIGENVYSY